MRGRRDAGPVVGRERGLRLEPVLLEGGHEDVEQLCVGDLPLGHGPCAESARARAPRLVSPPIEAMRLPPGAPTSCSGSLVAVAPSTRWMMACELRVTRTAGGGAVGRTAVPAAVRRIRPSARCSSPSSGGVALCRRTCAALLVAEDATAVDTGGAAGERVLLSLVGSPRPSRFVRPRLLPSARDASTGSSKGRTA